MKKISTLLFFCICLSMAFVSCSSDDGNNPIDDMTGQETDDMTSDETGDMTGEDTGNQDPITITDGFIFNKEKYPTPFVTKSIFNGYYQLTFAKENFDTNDYSGNLNIVGFLISSPTAEIIPGTYTFKLDSDADYDPSKHFFDALAGVDLQYTNGEPDLSSGFFDNITSGTVTIAKENTTYTITYEFVYPEGTFEGNYKGEIKNSEEIKTPPSLIGKWELIELSENGVIEEMQCPTNDTLEFLENNQAILTVYLQGRSDGMGGVTRFCVDNPTPDQLGWLLNDKTITFDFGGGDTEEAQITEFTDSRLVLKYMYEDGGQTFEDIEVYTKSTTP